MTEKIKDLVSVNRQATLTKGVQLDWYRNPQQEEENERLAGGYIFSSGATGRDSRAAIDIFTDIRDTLTMSGTHNVFTIIAAYGHGKSHFALVLANYFGRTVGDSVLEKVIRQIEACTNENTAHLFKAFKAQAQKPQLVVRLSGHDFRDLRQGFMKALRRALDENEQSRGYQIQAITVKAVEWLRSPLMNERRQQAQSILDEHYQLDLDALIKDLEGFDSTKESIARDLSLRLNGVAADFGADLNLREVINKVIADLCVGANAPYHKMVVLFDELGIYAEKWCANRMAAGDLAPQQLLEACDNNKGKMCLVAFIQREINEAVRSYELQDDFRKWAERFPIEKRYFLESSLERVIKGLLQKNGSVWNEFARDNLPRIENVSDEAWHTLPYYQDKPAQWTPSEFVSTVGVGAFPFHPLTTGLLCNLSFTQGARTIIEVVATAIESKSEESSIQPDGKLNLILPTFLVDEFAVYFDGQESRYSLYTNARDRLGANAPSEFYEILKAMFLYEVGGLKRDQNQSHVEVLTQMCGLSEKAVRDVLKQLDEEHGVIRFSQAKREYEFSGIGTSKNEIREKINRLIVGRVVPNLAAKLESLKLLDNITLEESEASKYKAERGLEGEEWRLKPRLLDASKLNIETVKRVATEANEARGTVIYVVSCDSAELDDAQERATRILDQLRVGDNPYPIVLAVPTSPAVGLDQEVLTHDELRNWNEGQRRHYGEGYNDAINDCERCLKDAFEAYLRKDSLRYHVANIVSQRFKSNEAQRLDSIANRLFEEAFPYRVPARFHLMKTSSTQGNSVVATIARQLIVNEIDYGSLETKAQNLIIHVLVEGLDKWGVLTAKYRLQEPKDEHILKAWELLNELVLDDRPTSFEKINTQLKGIPFGHDDYTLTLLYAAWIGWHKNELQFHGQMQQLISLDVFREKTNKAKDFIRWLNEHRVTIQRPSKSIKQKAKNYLDKLEKVTKLDEAQKLLGKKDEIIINLPDEDEVRAKIIEQARKWEDEINKIKNHQKDVQSVRSTIEKTDNIIQLLRFAKSFPSKLTTSLEYDETFYSEAKSFLEQRIEAQVRQQTQQPLKKIEDYTSLCDKLKEMKAALRKYGRHDLEQFCIHALERIEEEHETLKNKTEEAAKQKVRQVQITSLMQTLQDRVKRVVKAQSFELAIADINDVYEVAAPPATIDLTDAEQANVDKEIKNAQNRIEVLFHEFLRPRDLKSEGAFTNRQTEFERALSALQNTLNVPAEWLQKIKEARQQFDKDFADWREMRSRDIAKRIIEDFGKLETPQQRADCLLQIAEVCKADGLSAEYMSRLIEILELREAADA
jgi:hypothetical protein